MQVLLTLKFSGVDLGVIHGDCFMNSFTAIIQTEKGSVIEDTLTWVDEMKLGYRVGHDIKARSVPCMTVRDFALSEANTIIRDSIEMAEGTIDLRINETPGDSVSILNVRTTLESIDLGLNISMSVVK